MTRLLRSLALTLIFIFNTQALALEFSARQSLSTKLSFKVEGIPTLETTSLSLCSSDPDFRIRAVQFIDPNTGRPPRHAARLSIMMDENNCFVVGNIQLPHSGLWEIHILDAKDHISTLPFPVVAQSFDLVNEFKRPIAKLHVSKPVTQKSYEVWLFCGKKLVNDIYLLNQETNEKVTQKHLKDFGDNCRIFSQLPLPRSGRWQLIAVLDNGEKLRSIVDYRP